MTNFERYILWPLMTTLFVLCVVCLIGICIGAFIQYGFLGGFGITALFAFTFWAQMEAKP